MGRIEVIAEIANAHQGDPLLAAALARASSEAGADAVKFQIYSAEELLVPSHPRYAHFQRQAFAAPVWSDLLAQATELHARVYADVFGLASLDVAVAAQVDGLKIHSSDLMNAFLLDRVRELELPVYLAVGGSTVPEIRYAVNRLTSGRVKNLVLLHGFQAYPTTIDSTALNRLTELRTLFGDRAGIGYADHSSGDGPFATALPLMAVSLGVDALEKHVTLDRAAQGVDYYSSLEPPELKHFIAELRQAETALAPDPLHFSEPEREYRRTVKKHWVAVRDLPVGHTIRPDDVTMRRVHDAPDPPPLSAIVGKRLGAAKRRDETISRSELSYSVLAIVVARSASSRLPGKATLDLNGRPALQHLFERLRLAKTRGFIDTVAFCTTTAPEDQQLVELAEPYPFDVYRGSVNDVLDRMMLAVADHADHDLCLRITGDDLLVDPDYLHQTVQHHLASNAQYTDAKRLPSGTEVEVFDTELLRLMHDVLHDSSGTEYLTTYIQHHADQFNLASLPVPEKHTQSHRLTLDTPQDFEVIRGLLAHMSTIGREFDYTLDDICGYFDAHPGASAANTQIVQRATPPSVDTRMDWTSYTAEPLVTVYITNHDYGRFLEHAIQSVLKQKLRDFELLIIDDGSTDESATVLARYENHDRVTVVFQENKGLAVSNNIATQLARGKYVIRLDADDFLEENALLVMTNRMEREPQLALLFPDYYVTNEDGVVIGQQQRHDFREVTLLDEPAHGACTMIRRDVLKEVGGYSEEFDRQDGYDLWLKVIDHYPVGNVNLPLFYYRQHESNLSGDSGRLLATRHEIIRKHSGSLGIEERHHLCVVPMRAGPLALRPFAGTTLLDITLQTILASGRFDHVCLTSPDTALLDHTAAAYGDQVLLDSRPPELARLNTPIEETLDYLFEQGRVPGCDTITVANCEYPFRKPLYLEKAINLLYLYDADSVISVQKETTNFFHPSGHGLTPFDTNRSLHLEQSGIYREIGGIHAVKSASYAEHRKINGGVMTQFLIDDLSAVRVATETEFAVYEAAYEKGIRGES